MVQWTPMSPDIFGPAGRDFRLYITEPNSFRNPPDRSNACSDLLDHFVISLLPAFLLLLIFLLGQFYRTASNRGHPSRLRSIFECRLRSLEWRDGLMKQ